MHPISPPPASPGRRRSLLALVGLGMGAGLGWAPATTRSATRELRVLTAPDPAAQRAILQALRARYPGMIADADPVALDARHLPGPIVSIGPTALQRALEADIKATVVSIFTSSQTCRRLIGAVAAHERPAPVTALYADASPHAQLQLVAALFERRVTVGVLLSEASAYLERPLRQAAALTGVELLIERPAPASDVVRALNRLGGAQALLAVPDSTLYTPDTLRSVLESTYRRGLPVIGFSSATVAAGTLATAYPAVDDVMADLAELLDALGAQPGGAPLPEPRFSRYWRVAVNDNVARSLGIAISDKVLNLGNHPPGRPA